MNLTRRVKKRAARTRSAIERRSPWGRATAKRRATKCREPPTRWVAPSRLKEGLPLR